MHAPARKALLLLAVSMPMACDGDLPNALDAAAPVVDAGSADAGDLPCMAAEAQTFYADFDGDGYGTPELTAVDCSPPERFVDNNLDCDDADSRSNPEGVELCDGLDNDCNAATAEVCINACSPQLRDGDTYLYCAQVQTFSAAKAACVAEGMHLIRIDDQAEQTWMSTQRSIAFGALPRIWSGANDATSEGIWVWHDNEQFWQGNAGGVLIAGYFSFWRGGEPNNGDGVEDCATVDDNANARWDDRPCNQAFRFVCERDAEVIE